MRFEVLGPVAASDTGGGRVRLGGPRHREVLALLLAARGRVVTISSLVDDLWEEDPPARAVGSVRTFVSDLRRVLPPGLLVTEGAGYALRTDDVDAVRAERGVRTAEGAEASVAEPLLAAALAEWKGEPYADFAERAWPRPERARLAELHAQAVEHRAAAQLALGRADEVVLALDPHVLAHPWREEGWRLLAEALNEGGRRADALAVLRRARERLADSLGLDPGRRLSDLETRILRDDVAPATSLLLGTADAHRATSTRAQLTASVPLIAALAVSGDLAAAQRQRLAAIRAAEPFADPELTARVIGGYAVPSIWTRSDDPEAAAAVVAAAHRTLSSLTAPGPPQPPPAQPPAPTAPTSAAPPAPTPAAPTSAAPAAPAPAAPAPAAPEPAAPAAPTAADKRAPTPRAFEPASRPPLAPTSTTRTSSTPVTPSTRLRARLLATIATEERGTAARNAEAHEAERLARDLGDPALLVFALGGRWMQSFGRCGMAAEREGIGAEIVAIAVAHDLPEAQIQGRLIRMQALCALGSAEAAEAAEAEAEAVDVLAARHERPLASVFTGLFRAMTSGAGYEAAVAAVTGSGMTGLQPGLVSLARAAAGEVPPQGADGPYRPWLDALRGARPPATVPDPPKDLLQEMLWILLGRAADQAGDRATAHRVRTALAPAAGEIAAGSGVVSAGPIAAALVTASG